MEAEPNSISINRASLSPQPHQHWPSITYLVWNREHCDVGLGDGKLHCYACLFLFFVLLSRSQLFAEFGDFIFDCDNYCLLPEGVEMRTGTILVYRCQDVKMLGVPDHFQFETVFLSAFSVSM